MERIDMEQKKEELIDKIIDLEWNQFTNVQNEGGRASCQDDRATFEIMRKSQFSIWSEEALTSWLNDIQEAVSQGRNVMTEKYAYMMQDTAPEEFAKIKSLLPVISQEKLDLVNELAQKQVSWREEVNAMYPNLALHGRCLRKSDAFPGETSLETYAYGELCTYSETTLNLLKECWGNLENQGHNPGADILLETVKAYGYSSLSDAQNKI